MHRPTGNKQPRKKPRRLTKLTVSSLTEESDVTTTNSSAKPDTNSHNHGQAQRIHLAHNQLLKLSQQGRIALNAEWGYMRVAIVQLAKSSPPRRKDLHRPLTDPGKSTFLGLQTLGMWPCCAVLVLLLVPFSLRFCELCGSALLARWYLRRC